MVPMKKSFYFPILLLSTAFANLHADQPIPSMALQANAASQQVTVSWAKTSLSASNQTPLFFDFQLQAAGDLKFANAWTNSGPFIPGGLGGSSTTLSQTVTASAAGFFRLLRGLNLPGENMAGLDFSEVDFTQGNLAGADLSGADLQNTLFDEADLSNADLSGANLTGADFTTANLDGTIFDSLGGPPEGPAGESTPLMPYVVDYASFDTNTMMSTNILLVFPEPSATVMQINSLLASNNGTIVGGFPGTTNATDTSMLVVRFPSLGPGGLPQMENVFTSNPAINDAFPDSLLFGDALPNLEDAHPVWTLWEEETDKDNWGIRLCRFPQLWNFNEYIQEKINLGEQNRKIPIGIIDGGYNLQHPELKDNINLVRRAIDHNHGTHVAGTIAAAHDGKGMDGATPFATLYVTGADSNSILVAGEDLGRGVITVGSKFCDFVLLLELESDVKIVNISMGRNFREVNIDPTTNTAAQSRIEREAIQFRAVVNRQNAPLVIKSAGNEGYPAEWGGGVNYASLILNNPHIIVVEALQGSSTYGSDSLVTQWGTNLTYGSNFGADLSAPGFNILSSVGTNGYNRNSGTSMSSPLVTGLASYLLSLQPDLTRTELQSLLTSGVTAVPGAANRINAWYAALFIDGMRPNTPMLRALLDIDDGTEDGNQRVTMLAKFNDEDDPSTFDTEPFPESDLNNIGDGVIDMSDFRRFRDWNLISDAAWGETALDDGLDGPPDHPKNDPNRNGVPAPTDDYEAYYPRTDFNGDSYSYDPTFMAYMPAPFSAPVTDLEVFQHLFEDLEGNYIADDLPNLVDSSDMHVSLYWFMNYNTDPELLEEDKISQVTITIDSRDPRIIRTHTIILPPGEPDRRAHYMITLANSTQHRIYACGKKANDEEVGGDQRLFNFSGPAGDDYWFAPHVIPEAICGPAEE